MGGLFVICLLFCCVCLCDLLVWLLVGEGNGLWGGLVVILLRFCSGSLVVLSEWASLVVDLV